MIGLKRGLLLGLICIGIIGLFVHFIINIQVLLVFVIVCMITIGFTILVYGIRGC